MGHKWFCLQVPPFSPNAESAWHEYVRDGKAPALFAFMEEKRRLEEEEDWLVDSDSETDPVAAKKTAEEAEKKVRTLAVDAVRLINDAGVINMDCQPHNVLVQRESLRPLRRGYGSARVRGQATAGQLESYRERHGNKFAKDRR
ncbi:hypothetical protein B0T25DRAFT_586178 [Lasiosphaeria hispida]|uniref:Uncharacterized protein n=1 Tax=Lasiosphaeria hispida TaxID=260671 RepID=A0AAJ0H7L6_9PEZI|nr:hypothetical protein B0T25DRAFT_586178 [Lasiosphaeria hispida]